jgi:hypothetical protein
MGRAERDGPIGLIASHLHCLMFTVGYYVNSGCHSDSDSSPSVRFRSPNGHILQLAGPDLAVPGIPG